ncbi:MAG: DAK2 domain-containing protein [Candidatus Ornithospirochaeta sp.]|nr:DAK2 domain-containing protein [Candidatus Ornithospirochaeta sp.]
MGHAIDGLVMDRMLNGGLSYLCSEEEEINALNVFPVSDGDTGTNMALTLRNGLASATQSKDLSVYLDGLSRGMLLGARGNSGVILSQIFKGFQSSFSGKSEGSVCDFADALRDAYKQAYSSVIEPVEGTILTVTREGIEQTREIWGEDDDLEAFLEIYLDQMEKSLENTPNLLSVLKEAGVVDSGAKGFISIVKGMLQALRGEIMPVALERREKREAIDYDAFTENDVLAEGYCTEFVLQRLNSDSYDHCFSLASFSSELQELGSSIVISEEGTRVKVHVHTAKPAPVIELAQRYGEFLSFKLENMQLQHNSISMKKHKTIATIAVTNGNGMRESFSSIGCDEILDGGFTMNPSAEEFLNAILRLNADRIVILPNNRNALFSAQQAVSLSGKDNIVIIPTISPAAGYLALTMDMPDSNDSDSRIQSIRRGMDSCITFSVAKASKDCVVDGIPCTTDDYIAFHDTSMAFVSDEPVKALLEAMERTGAVEDAETCLAFSGEDVDDDEKERLYEALSARYPMMDINILDGGQRIHPWIIGVF